MSVLATDNFNRADSSTLGGNWATAKGESASCQIKSNILVGDAATSLNIGNYYTNAVWPNDQWSQATIQSGAAGGNDNAFAAVRMITTGTTRYCYYGGYGKNFSGDALPRIYKDVNSSRTSLASGSGNIVAGDVIYLEVQGTSVALKINGTTKATVTDSSHSSGSAGLRAGSENGSTTVFDDWSGGDFTTPPSGTLLRVNMEGIPGRTMQGGFDS